MTSQPMTPDDYIQGLPDDRKTAVTNLRHTILEHLPVGFVEEISYDMISYVVPHTIFPDGYHCNPSLPLPFMSISSVKGHIGFHHMGLYADDSLLQWFVDQYPTHSKRKLNMGKSCIRFKNPEHIPLTLISELVTKMNVNQWIDLYQTAIGKA